MIEPELVGGVYPWKAHFAYARGLRTVNTLDSMISEGKLPPLPKPLPERGPNRQMIWTQSALESWTSYLQIWDADAPTRALAKAAEREQRHEREREQMMARFEAEAARNRKLAEVMKAQQDAAAEADASRQAAAEAASKAWGQ